MKSKEITKILNKGSKSQLIKLVIRDILREMYTGKGLLSDEDLQEVRSKLHEYELTHAGIYFRVLGVAYDTVKISKYAGTLYYYTTSVKHIVDITKHIAQIIKQPKKEWEQHLQVFTGMNYQYEDITLVKLESVMKSNISEAKSGLYYLKKLHQSKLKKYDIHALDSVEIDPQFKDFEVELKLAKKSKAYMLAQFRLLLDSYIVDDSLHTLESNKAFLEEIKELLIEKEQDEERKEQLKRLLKLDVIRELIELLRKAKRYIIAPEIRKKYYKITKSKAPTNENEMIALMDDKNLLLKKSEQQREHLNKVVKRATAIILNTFKDE